MKLNIATTALASAAIVLSMSATSVSAAYSDANSGTCLSAVVSNAGQHDDEDLSDEATYYTINGNDNGEAQAQYNIQTQMQSLASTLNMNVDEDQGGPDEELK